MTSSLHNQFSSSATTKRSSGQNLPGLSDLRSFSDPTTGGQHGTPVDFETLMPGAPGPDSGPASSRRRDAHQTGEQGQSAQAALQGTVQPVNGGVVAAVEGNEPAVLKPEQLEQSVTFAGALQPFSVPADAGQAGAPGQSDRSALQGTVRPMKSGTVVPADAGEPSVVSPEQPARTTTYGGAWRQISRPADADQAGKPGQSAQASFLGADLQMAGEAIVVAEECEPAEIKPEQLEQAAAFAGALMEILRPAEPAGATLSAPTDQLLGRSEDLSYSPSGAPSRKLAEGAISLRSEDRVTADPQLAGKDAGSPKPAVPEFSVASDGAIECELPSISGNAAGPSGDSADFDRLELQAELEIPGQPVIRVGFGGLGREILSTPKAGEKFAEVNSAKGEGIYFEGNGSERKMLNVEEKIVKTTSNESGIAIAKARSAMSTAPSEIISSVRPSGTVLDGTTQIVSAGESPVPAQISAAPGESVPENFAERAVATVTGLAEAQFSVSMQKTGRVQLRLKFGTENLNVRIELRDGLVHTDFQSDSPALRAAIMQEWQNVASSSQGRLQQFLDPIFSPGTASPAADTGAQGQSFQRPQQQAHDQAAARNDGWSAPTSFSRRSVLSETFSPEPAVSRVPLQLPTSLRLSALA